MELTPAQIESLIPHRKPFLFIKSANITSRDEIEGVAAWDADNPLLEGHFPGFPVVPGVLVIEAAAQLAGVLIAHNGPSRTSAPDTGTPEAGSLIGMLIGVRRSSFHKPVMPGDRLGFTVKLQNAIGGMMSVTASATGTGGAIVFKGELSVAVVEKNRLLQPQSATA